MFVGDVPPSISEPIKSKLLGDSHWPWFITAETSGVDEGYHDSIHDALSGEDPQFQHNVVNDGNVCSQHAWDYVAEPLWNYLNQEYSYEIGDVLGIRRVKMNLLTRKETKHLYHTPHDRDWET